ncbi:MAG: response regulator transcription factor [Acidimicrobiia bacterium]|nr:response regulator transcription factor [Acidimicrobiia bacterium]
MDARILFAEDDPSIRETTQLGLEAVGFRVECAVDGDDALARFRASRPDLVLLDVMMPKRDGFEVCRIIRRDSNIPVIMLTARTDSIDVVVGLESGADDYVTKPFDLPVLVARIRAALRRARDDDPVEVLTLGDVTIDVLGHSAERQGQELALTPTEFRLLAELARSPGRVLSRELLLENVWGYDYLGDSRIVDMAIQRLRSKIEADPGSPQLIQTVRGAGYRARR